MFIKVNVWLNKVNPTVSESSQMKSSVKFHLINRKIFVTENCKTFT